MERDSSCPPVEAQVEAGPVDEPAAAAPAAPVRDPYRDIPPIYAGDGGIRWRVGR